MYQTFPELCTPYVEKVASLFIALRAYCSKDRNPYCEFSLNQISSNGIGVHLEFSFKNHNRTISYKEKIFVPNTEIPKLLGKKIVKFSYGDAIPPHYFVPSILEWLDHPKMKDIINRIRYSSVFR